MRERLLLLSLQNQTGKIRWGGAPFSLSSLPTRRDATRRGQSKNHRQTKKTKNWHRETTRLTNETDANAPTLMKNELLLHMALTTTAMTTGGGRSLYASSSSSAGNVASTAATCAAKYSGSIFSEEASTYVTKSMADRKLIRQ